MLEPVYCIRKRAANSLLVDSRARKSEIVAIKTNDVDLEKNCIKVMGKLRRPMSSDAYKRTAPLIHFLIWIQKA